jgi:PAS domain S-box-containing protein
MLTNTYDAIIVVDENLIIYYINDIAKMMLSLEEHTYEGLHIYNDLNLFEIAPGRVQILQELIEKGVGQRGIIRKTRNGKHLSINIDPLLENGSKKGLLLSARDISRYIEIEQELDMAFALTLPNSKVESKLKKLVEYQDHYDPQSKRITITGIIKDGGYRHVVNCLKLFSTHIISW